MPAPTITDAAMQKLRELVAQCADERPLVIVSREPYGFDNHRDSSGKTVWTHTPARWNVSVGGHRFAEDAGLQTVKIADLEFLSGPDHGWLEGLKIDYAADKFIVIVE